MPFDQSRTIHTFTPTSDGGVQTVTAIDASDTAQIASVQSHLQVEAERFARGDYSDPAQIHGAEMPGLSELAAGAAEISVRYSSIPAGGKIEYQTSQPKLVAALHSWFSAQVMDHGEHAHSG